MSVQHVWNQVFERVRREGHAALQDHHWLASYLPMLRGQEVRRILEIGCGSGMDTAFLSKAGFAVTATDFSMQALAMVRDRLPDVPLMLHDMRERYPFADESFDLVLANLSLHYFTLEATADILREIKRLLRPRGLLLYRVNSSQDAMNGQGVRLGVNFYRQDGLERRYYTLDDCRALMHDFEEILLEEKQVPTYGKVKTLCESLVRKW